MVVSVGADEKPLFATGFYDCLCNTQYISITDPSAAFLCQSLVDNSKASIHFPGREKIRFPHLWQKYLFLLTETISYSFCLLIKIGNSNALGLCALETSKTGRGLIWLDSDSHLQELSPSHFTSRGWNAGVYHWKETAPVSYSGEATHIVCYIEIFFCVCCFTKFFLIKMERPLLKSMSNRVIRSENGILSMMMLF